MNVSTDKYTFSLRQFLALPFLALFLVMGAISLWVFYEKSESMGHQVEQQLALGLDTRVNLYLNQIFSEPVNAVNAAAGLYHSGKLNAVDAEGQAKQLAAVISGLPELTALNIGFEDGRDIGVDRSLLNGVLHTSVVASGAQPYRDVYSVNENGQRDLFLFRDPNSFVPGTRAWYRHAVEQRKAGWYPIYRYPSSEIADVIGNFGIGYSMPLYDDQNKLVGAINSDIALGQISRYLNLLPLAPGGLVFVANELNQVIGISDGTPLFSRQDENSTPQLTHFDNNASPPIRLAGERLLKNGFGASYLKLQDKTYIEDVHALQTSSGLNLKVVVLLPETQFFPTMQSDIRSMVIYVLIALLIGIALVLLLAVQLSKPIIEMTRWAEMLSHSNWGRISSADEKALKDYPVKELRQLRTSLSTMAGNLRETVATLEERVAERTAELELVNSNLFELSNTDGLTGIPNRRKFDEVLSNEWKRAMRSNQPLVVALIDVDWFKKYNDHNGHLAGDDCLRSVANILKAKIRRSSDLVARFGGEEFAIISPGINKANAIEMANIICKAIAEANLPHTMSPFGMITVSVGVALIVPTATTPPETLIQAADEALYHAKDSGRNQVVCAEIDVADHENYFESEFKFERT
ncbi:diguanylate cyclase (GGDEF)-like protein [Oxalobacteraceae bacterium GrIS 1.18]